jgi:predicted acyltransferase
VGDFEWATLRVPDVPQRIAVGYLVAAVLFLTTGWRTQALLAGGLLLGYWGALTLVPVPGYGAGHLSKAGNLPAYLDRVLLGPHIWRVSRVYDPEGVLSTAPAVATTLLGVLTGHWLQVCSAWLPVNKALWTWCSASTPWPSYFLSSLAAPASSPPDFAGRASVA